MVHTISARAGVVEEIRPLSIVEYFTFTAMYDLTLRRGVGFRAGARLAYGEGYAEPPFAPEGFVGAYLMPRFPTLVDGDGRTGAWAPAVGFEAGASAARYGSRNPYGDEHATTFVGVAAEPLRFHLSRFTASAIGFTFSAPLTRPAEVLRIDLHLLTVGWRL